MIEKVAEFLKKYDIKKKTVLVAVSGGVDSVVLLHILNSLKNEFSLDIKVIHLNHNWRGEASQGDMEFVQSLANDMGLEFYCDILDDDIKKTELCARDARYSFFEKALEKFETNVCFLAHNKNDNVETFLYRVIKGTGVSGLVSIPVVRPPYYRPLLNFSRCEIEEFAAKNGIKFRTDASNEDIKYKRNFIRKNIVPEILKINDNAINSIGSLIGIAAEHNEIIEDYLKTIENEVFDKNCTDWAHRRPLIIRDKFLSLKPAVQREILSRYFKGLLKNRDFKNILKIQNFIIENENSTLSVNRDTFLRVHKNGIFLYKKMSK